jgi:hypothetical protein
MIDVSILELGRKKMTPDKKTPETHVILLVNAPRIFHWLLTRGGISVWSSINPANPAKSWTTPRLAEDGTLMKKPSWEAAEVPRVITDPAEVLVSIDTEVKRFKISTQESSDGLYTKLTDASAERIRSEVEKAGENSYYGFDYERQEAIIYQNEKLIPITEYVQQTVGA